MRLASFLLLALLEGAGQVACKAPPASALEQRDQAWVAERCALAERARIDGRGEEALAGYRAALAADPACEPAHRGYQDLLLAQGKGEELCAEYAELAERLGEPWCLFLYGRVLFDPAREEALYREAIEREPLNPALHGALASALRRQLRFEEADQAAARWVELAPADVDAHLALATAEGSLGRGDEVLAEYEERALRAPDDVVPHLVLVKLLTQRAAVAEAEIHLERAQELAPELPQTRRARLVVAASLDDRAEVDAALEACLASDPGDAEALTLAGSYLASKEEPDEALGVELLRRADRLAPTSSRPIAGLGRELLQDLKLLQAEPLLDEALRRNPAESVALAGKAWLASLREHDDQALELCEQARRAEDSRVVRRQLFYVCMKPDIQDFERATGLLHAPGGFEGWASRDPDERATERLFATRLYLSLGRIDEAWSLASAGIGSGDCHATALAAAALVLERQGDLDGATVLAERGLERSESANPEDQSRILAQWARLLLKSGRREEACQAYRDLWSKHSQDLPTGLDAFEMFQTLESSPAEAASGALAYDVAVLVQGKNSCLSDATQAMLKRFGKQLDPCDLTNLLANPQLSDSRRLMGAFDGLAAIPFLIDREALQRLVELGCPPLVTMLIYSMGRIRGHAALVVGYDDGLGLLQVVDSGTLGAGVINYGVIEGERGIALLPADLAREAEAWLPGVEYCRLIDQAEQYFAHKEVDAACEVLERAVALNPSCPHAHRGLIFGNTLRGEPLDSEPMLEHLCALPGALPVDFCQLGTFELERGDMVGAKKALREAVKRRPDCLDACEQLLVVAVKEEERPESILYAAERVLDLDPLNAYALHWRGYAHLWQGSPDRAGDDLELSLGLEESGDGWWHLATARENSGNLPGAIEALERDERYILGQGSEDSAVTEVRERLQGLRAQLAEAPVASIGP